MQNQQETKSFIKIDKKTLLGVTLLLTVIMVLVGALTQIVTPGAYETAADGSIIATTTIHKALSYSQEYNAFADKDVAAALIASIAKYGDGEVINTAYEVYDDATKYFDRTYDPRIPFIIIVIVLFLLDVAVRKFKFKWIHEIIRERKKRKAK